MYLYGYRVGEVDVSYEGITMDDSYLLHSLDNCEVKDTIMRRSLGCHWFASPVPDIYHWPSQITSLAKRIGRKMPEIDRAVYERWKVFVVKFLEDNFAELRFKSNHVFCFEKWLKEINHPESRKKQYRAAKEKKFNIAKHCDLQGFTKDEAYPSYKFFRGIYSRVDQFKVQIGPFCHELGKIIFNTKFFIKKTPVMDRPNKIRKLVSDFVHVMFTDYESFESWFTKKIMKIQKLVYRWFLKDHPDLEKIMNLYDHGPFSLNKIHFKHFCFLIECKRMSGEMDTSEANGLMNLLASLFILQEAGAEYVDGLVEGDDGVFVFTGKEIFDTAFPTEDMYNDLGARIKIEIPERPTEGSFCGQIFDKTVMHNCADPIRHLTNFGWCGRQYLKASRSKLDALIRSKALSLLSECGGSPILRELALYGIRVTSHIDDKYLRKVIRSEKLSVYEREMKERDLEHIDKMISIQVDSRTRGVFQRVYKISVALQLKTEEYLRSLNQIQPLVMPWLEPYLGKDRRDFYKRYKTDGKVGRNMQPHNKYRIYYEGDNFDLL